LIVQFNYQKPPFFSGGFLRHFLIFLPIFLEKLNFRLIFD